MAGKEACPVAANPTPSLQPGACDQDLNTRQTCFCSVGGGLATPRSLWGLSSLSRGRLVPCPGVEPIPSAVKAWRPKLWDLKGSPSSTFCHVLPGVPPFVPSSAASGPRASDHQLWTPVISRDPGCCWRVGCVRRGHVLSPPHHLHHLALSCSSCFSFAFTKPLDLPQRSVEAAGSAEAVGAHLPRANGILVYLGVCAVSCWTCAFRTRTELLGTQDGGAGLPANWWLEDRSWGGRPPEFIKDKMALVGMQSGELSGQAPYPFLSACLRSSG